jgi:hypothetical protein
VHSLAVPKFGVNLTFQSQARVTGNVTHMKAYAHQKYGNRFSSFESPSAPRSSDAVLRLLNLQEFVLQASCL